MAISYASIYLGAALGFVNDRLNVIPVAYASCKFDPGECTSSETNYFFNGLLPGRSGDTPVVLDIA